MNVHRLLTLLSALFLTSCGMVTVKQIAGDRVPENLTARLCNVSWRGTDGTVGVFRVEDEAKGLYEVRSKKPGEKEDRIHFAFRTLGERVVATVWGDEQAKKKEPMIFLRAAISDEHIAFFMPDCGKFTDAVKKKLIAGQVEEDPEQWGEKDGKNPPQKIERPVLEKFGAAEADKLGGALACFDPDPDLVLVRETAKPRAATKKSGSGKIKK
jgi:hypothetical protein